MKKLMRKFETAMMAVAFAEAGEHETARRIMNEERERKSERPSSHKRVQPRKELRAD